MGQNELENRNEGKAKWFSKAWKCVKEISIFVAGLGAFLAGVDTVYERYIAVPDIKYVINESGVECFECDFELKDAQLYIHPQILLTEGERIIRMISTEAFCEETCLDYNKQINGFEFKGVEWDDIMTSCSKIKEEITEPHEELHIKKSYLLKMVYKKKRTGKQKEAFYIVDEGELSRNVKEAVLLERGQDIDISLEELELNIEKIVSDCDTILKQN